MSSNGNHNGNGKHQKVGPFRELLSLLFEPDFVVDEKPIEIKKGQHQLSTVKMAAITEEKLETYDLIHIFSDIVQREIKAIERAKLAESQPSQDDKQLERLMKQLLPFLDSFDHILEMARAAPPSEEVTNWLKSIEALYFRILKILERFGLVPLNTIGRVVDLDFHEVVEYRPSADHPGDCVISERQKGYLFNGRLLRVAQVVVARPVRS